ncbi:MAG TPA: DUF4852 domain-containing protein [Alphaproteobacteria bacterium]|nr:DUF4852 domain-containing protein [Alphaproteobacteria bacterium]
MSKRLGLLLLCLLLALPARADDYAAPTLANLAHTLVRFGAFDLTDDNLLDQYAMITDCDIYQRFYGNDFQWQRVRKLIRQDIKLNIGSYPIDYGYDAEMQLDRYDFRQHVFHFTPKTVVGSVNAITIYQTEDAPTCGTAKIADLPHIYRAVFDVPVTLEGLPLAPADAQALLKQMDKDKNRDRIVYAQFNLRIVYIEPIHRVATGGGAPVKYLQAGQTVDTHGIQFAARLDSVDFYEDPARTRLIYTYKP